MAELGVGASLMWLEGSQRREVRSRWGDKWEQLFRLQGTTSHWTSSWSADLRKDSKPGKSESWKRKESVTHLKRKRMTKRQHITVQKSPFEAHYRFIWKFINISHAHHITAPSTLHSPIPAGVRSASGGPEWGTWWKLATCWTFSALSYHFA